MNESFVSACANAITIVLMICLYMDKGNRPHCFYPQRPPALHRSANCLMISKERGAF